MFFLNQYFVSCVNIYIFKASVGNVEIAIKKCSCSFRLLKISETSTDTAEHKCYNEYFMVLRNVTFLGFYQNYFNCHNTSKFWLKSFSQFVVLGPILWKILQVPHQQFSESFTNRKEAVKHPRKSLASIVQRARFQRVRIKVSTWFTPRTKDYCRYQMTW